LHSFPASGQILVSQGGTIIQLPVTFFELLSYDRFLHFVTNQKNPIDYAPIIQKSPLDYIGQRGDFQFHEKTEFGGAEARRLKEGNHPNDV
jgi:hypothetical protein